MIRVYSKILTLALLVLIIDQWTKQLAIEYLEVENNSVDFISWWKWTLVHNHAAAFGVFGSLAKTFFLSFPLAILFFLWKFFILTFERDEKFRPIIMGLVFGGALGNLVDRVRHGYVIDFIDWNYPVESGSCLPLFHYFAGACHWPVFNFADSAITAAMILLVVETIFFANKRPQL